MKFSVNGLELEKDKNEQRILSNIGQSTELVGSPDMEDFFDRIVLAAPGVSWGKDAWREHELDEKTQFTLTEAGNLVIPASELRILYRGIKKFVDDPIYNNDEYTSETGEFLKEAIKTLEENVPDVSES